ncbi:MAG TPA: pseudouridine synthase [Ktedonobacteraceae bacterium]|nr:pseudouridine synthase [Ktedonobacteraceae bacterium]
MIEPTGERLARFLAHAGVASRRHAEDLIAAGRVQVNGVTIREQGTRINPERDVVLVDDKVIQASSQQVSILLHKPVGYLSTVSDPHGRPTVLDLLPANLRKLRVYPVGRLDSDTSGLLLLTNDGNFALHLTHPRYALEKHYEALVRGRPGNPLLRALRQGVVITEDDGRRYKTAPARVSVLRHEGDSTRLALTIHEGRKRQIRRMLAAIGLTVLELKRVGIGTLTLGSLPPGKWRYLSAEEITALRAASQADEV